MPAYPLLCFIARWEACVLLPYLDGQKWAQGFGDNDPTLTKDSPAITIGQAWARLAVNVAERIAIVDRLVRVTLRDEERAALTSFTYQAGSTIHSVADLINAGAVPEAMAVMAARVRNSKGEFRFGLQRRRYFEAQLFAEGDWGGFTQMRIYQSFPGPWSMVSFPPDTGA